MVTHPLTAQVLGRLEIVWRSLAGPAGRLQTQPILALPLAASGRQVQLRLGPLPQVGWFALGVEGGS